MWKKRYCAYTKKKVWCSKKATFHYQVKFFSFWFERYELWLRRFQTAVFRLTCCSNRCESTFQKTNDSWRKNRSWYKIFSRNRESKKFARAHREPHYAIAVTQRHLLFMHIRKIVLQNNWWFCAFVYLVRDINWNSVETTANVDS